MYYQDWLMSQIKIMIDMIAKIVFKKDNVKFNVHEESNSAEVYKLYDKLINLTNQLKLNEAEDILFEEINNNDLIYMKVAMDFYDRLNKLSDDELEIANFTREEIKSGLEDLLKLYNISLTI